MMMVFQLVMLSTVLPVALVMALSVSEERGAKLTATPKIE
jgi:hypothetical protein